MSPSVSSSWMRAASSIIARAITAASSTRHSHDSQGKPHIRIDPAGFGYGVVAFCLVEIDQKVGHDEVATALADAVPEIVDMHTVTGASDMQLRLVARDATQLQEVLDRVALVPGVARTASSIAMRTHLSGRVLPLVEHVATDEMP